MTGRRLPGFDMESHWGGSTCMNRESGDLCGRPGRWHVMWDHPDGLASVVCHLHFHAERDVLAIADFHEFGGVCNMPGTKWRAPGSAPSYCYFPLAEEERLTTHQTIHEPVGALS